MAPWGPWGHVLHAHTNKNDASKRSRIVVLAWLRDKAFVSENLPDKCVGSSQTSSPARCMDSIGVQPSGESASQNSSDGSVQRAIERMEEDDAWMAHLRRQGDYPGDTYSEQMNNPVNW